MPQHNARDSNTVTATHSTQNTSAAKNIIFGIISPEVKAQDFGMKTSAALAKKMHITQACGGFVALMCGRARPLSLTLVQHLEPTRKSQLDGKNLRSLSFQLLGKVEQETCSVRFSIECFMLEFLFFIFLYIYFFLSFYPFPSPPFSSLPLQRGFCAGAQSAHW